MKKRKYFHEISNEEFDKLVEDKVTIGTILKKYLQPDWCTYPKALAGKWGCWSLVSGDTRKKISKKFCRNCDCFSKQKAKKLTVEK